MTVELPQHEVLLSSCQLQGGFLTLRFVLDGFPANLAEQQVLCAKLQSVEDPLNILRRLEAVRASETYVYLARSEKGLTIEGENGENFAVGGEVLLSLDTYNIGELSVITERYQSLYKNRDDILRGQTMKILTVQDMVGEQARRIQIKMQSHPPGSTAHTLYTQHADFIERILRELS